MAWIPVTLWLTSLLIALGGLAFAVIATIIKLDTGVFTQYVMTIDLTALGLLVTARLVAAIMGRSKY